MESQIALEIVKVVASGAVGALSAVLAQYISAKHAEKRHATEIAQRERQMWAQFATPMASRRIDAYENIYDTIQTVVETGEISMSDYVALRKRLIYLEPAIRDPLLLELGRAIAATRSNDQSTISDSQSRLRDIQAHLESSLGLRTLEDGIRKLSNESGALKEQQ